MQRNCLTQLALALAIFTFSLSAFAYPVTSQSYPFKLGSKTVYIMQYRAGQGGYTYYHPHENERTSLAVGKQIIAQYGGKIIFLKHGGTRNITFYLAGERYTFDPNRIFTTRGIMLTLKKYSHYSETALQIVQQFANKIISLLPNNILVAIHNNTPDGDLSIKSYTKGQLFANDASAVYINPRQDPDDFFYVTTQDLFNFFKSKGFNVLLQSKQSVTDDGSLSVYAGQKNIPYVNIEAQDGHHQAQFKMLSALQQYKQ